MPSPYRLCPDSPTRPRAVRKLIRPWHLGAVASLAAHALVAALVPGSAATAPAALSMTADDFGASGLLRARVGLAEPSERPDALRRCFGSALVRSLVTEGGGLEAWDPGGTQVGAWCDAAADSELERGRDVAEVEEQRDCCHGEAEG